MFPIGWVANSLAIAPGKLIKRSTGFAIAHVRKRVPIYPNTSRHFTTVNGGVDVLVISGRMSSNRGQPVFTKRSTELELNQNDYHQIFTRIGLWRWVGVAIPAPFGKAVVGRRGCRRIASAMSRHSRLNMTCNILGHL